MLKGGSTKGAITGKNRVWNAGQVIDAPAGEFSHLGSSRFDVVREAPAREIAKLDPRKEKAVLPPTTTTPPADPLPTVNATEAARAFAEEYGIDLANVTGTGAGGRITKGDLEAMIEG